MTTTGSVWSTQTMRISPSGSSSTPSRSMRRVVTAAMVPATAWLRGGRLAGGTRTARSGGRRPVARAEARDPLFFQRLAQPVPGVLERHARHDGLEEPEHDELARLVRWDAPALEVEQLRLVDGADRRRVHRAPAVGLVDLQARDRHRACGLREVHAELAEVAVRADGGLLDRDEALHVAACLVHEDALREQLAGRVAADVPRVGGQVVQLLARPEHDLHLLDRAPIAGEDVVHAGSDEPCAELRERPAQVGRLSD